MAQHNVWIKKIKKEKFVMSTVFDVDVELEFSFWANFVSLINSFFHTFKTIYFLTCHISFDQRSNIVRIM